MIAGVTEAEILRGIADAREHVLGQIQTVRSPRHSRRFRVIRATAIAAIAALMLTAGGIAVLRASFEDVSYSVACYDGPGTYTAPVTVSAPAPMATDGTEAPRTRVDPVETCGEMWRMGLIGQEETPADPNAANFPVPALVGCVQANGVGAAFPRDDLPESDTLACGLLGLAVWTER